MIQKSFTLMITFGIMTPLVWGSSPWSLIQAKTSLHGNAGAVSSMDEALVFVQELAEKVVGHNVPLSDTEKSAIDTIQAYVKRMLEDIVKQRDHDQHEVNRYRQIVQSCADVAAEALANNVKTKETEANDARNDHGTCRQEEAQQESATSAECLKYDSYRRSPPGSSVPACMNGLRTSDISSTDPATKKDMEQCITQIHDWVVPLYDLYIKCKAANDDHLSKTKVCDSDQSTFEGAFCQWTTLLAGVCDTQTACRQKNIKTMEAGDKEVKVAEAARQADCEVGHKVDCLLKIFEEEDNTKKPGMLEACKKQTATCPDKIDYPPAPGPTPCVKSATEPCDSEWTESEYTSQSWYAIAPTITCQACHPPHPCKVTLYEKANFEGWAASFSPGDYPTRALERAGAKDDHASAMKVEAGCVAELYAHPDFTGHQAAFAEGSYDLAAFTARFPDDLVSSIKVKESALVTYVKSGIKEACPPGSEMINDQSQCFQAYDALKAANGWTGGKTSGTWDQVMQCGVHLKFANGNPGTTMVYFKTDGHDGSGGGSDWVHLCKKL